MMNNHLFEYALRLGDSSLIMSQRLGEWCGHGPILEEDIALTNIALDLIGQARAFLAYAGQIEGNGRTEDDLAYHRDVHQFRNLLMTEQPNGDFAATMVRQLLFSAYQYYWFTSLSHSSDSTIRALAIKSLKEVTYHLRHAKEWVIRLGDGTEESHQRAQDALNDLWLFTDDLFDADDTDRHMLEMGVGADTALVKKQWHEFIEPVFQEATLAMPEVNGFMRTGSRVGKHSEHLGYILAEMQFLPRAYPNAKW
jgi:ring-1,2-phenylacetyl-CoA epoxidase subunit PaaC